MNADEAPYERELTKINVALQQAHPMGDVMGIGLLNSAEALNDVFGDVLEATNPGADSKLISVIRGRLILARLSMQQ